MRVLDASVVIDAMAVTGPDGNRARQLVGEEIWLHVPAVLAAEVTSALRGMVRRGDLSEGAARSAAVRAGSIRAHRYPFEPFLQRTWDLRSNMTIYDAWYVALAERLNTVMVTVDQRLRKANGPHCEILTPAEALANR